MTEENRPPNKETVRCYSFTQAAFPFPVLHLVLQMLSCVTKTFVLINVLISKPSNLAFPVPEFHLSGIYLPSLENVKDPESDNKRDTLEKVLYSTSVISIGWLEMPGFASGHSGRIHGCDFGIVCFLDQKLMAQKH